MAVNDHNEIVLDSCRRQYLNNVTREETIATGFKVLGDMLAVVDVEVIKRAVVEPARRIRDDEDLERGVRKVAGWHCEVFDAAIPVFERETEEVPA